jgi:ribosome-associated protein
MRTLTLTPTSPNVAMPEGLSQPLPRPEQGKLIPSIYALVEDVFKAIDDAKAEEIIFLDLIGKTSLADAMLIASGTSDRHVNALAQRALHAIKLRGLPAPKVEGMPVCDWVLIDTGDIIIHLFRPEVRGFYNLEKLWGMGRPQDLNPGVEKLVARIEPEATPAARAKRSPTRVSAESAARKPAPRKPARSTAPRED